MPVVMKIGGVYVDGFGMVYEAIEAAASGMWLCKILSVDGASTNPASDRVGYKVTYEDGGKPYGTSQIGFQLQREIEP